MDYLGVKIGGYDINNIRYADDTTLITENEEGLKILVVCIVKTEQIIYSSTANKPT